MNPSSLTPQEYEMHVKDLCERLAAHLERGEGRASELFRDAEQVLLLRAEFPDVTARHPELDGLVADLLARRRQEQVMGSAEPRTAEGCAFGWLLGRRRRPRG